MAKIKHFSKDGLLTGEFTIIETDGVFAEWLVENYSEGDAFAVFKGEPSLENEITHNEAELLKDGEFVVLDTPSEPTTIAIVVALVISVAVIALAPKPELPQNVNRQQESPNNQLSSRSNQARPLQRVPDIKGELLSVPDVIMPTYSMYQTDKEVEHGYYCIGRKQLSISDVKDGDTPLNLITSASAGIYYPNKNPNNSASPDVQIGDEIIARDIYTPYRSNQVNGLVLSPDYGDGFFSAENLVVGRFSPYTDPSVNYFMIRRDLSDGFYIPSLYEVGSNVVLSSFIVNGSDLSGTYNIVSRDVFGQNDADVLICDFGATFPFNGLFNGSSGSMSSGNTTEYTDWAFITKEACLSSIVNVIAPNGMYKDNGGSTLIDAAVDYELQFQEVDDNDNLVGAIMTVTPSISGNNQQLKGNTTEYNFVTDGGKASAIKFACRAKRTTPRDTAFNGTVVDEIKLEDVYGLAELPNNHNFGDVTTIQTKTTATPFATAVKNRELNCIATEMLYPYLGGGSFSPTLTANNNAIQSFITDSIDPVIGNRTIDEIDADGILALKSEIDTYFGTDHHTKFSYTFDSTDVTYQDYAQTVFNAINCIAYREGSLVSAIFEKPQFIPAMLFTHRSKLPDSETYTRNFNSSTINDGVEFNWVDPATDTTETIYLNNGGSANPKQFNIAGIRDYQQAIIRAAREWNKIQYSKTSCEVGVTAEGRYVRPMDMVSIVKGTRVYTYDGEVLEVNGLELTLSQDVAFTPNELHSIILKNDDGTTDSILCQEGSEPNKILLGAPPQQTIRTGIDGRRTEFSFADDSRRFSQQWLVQEVDLTDKLAVNIKAINYTNEYYKDDGTDLSAFSSGFDDGFS